MDSILRYKVTLPTKCHLPRMGVCVLSSFCRVQLFVTLWTVVCQAPLYMGFSRHKYWSGFSCPPPGGLPYPEIKPAFLKYPVLNGRFFFFFFFFLPLALPGKPLPGMSES